MTSHPEETKESELKHDDARSRARMCPCGSGCTCAPCHCGTSCSCAERAKNAR